MALHPCGAADTLLPTHMHEEVVTARVSQALSAVSSTFNSAIPLVQRLHSHQARSHAHCYHGRENAPLGCGYDTRPDSTPSDSYTPTRAQSALRCTYSPRHLQHHRPLRLRDLAATLHLLRRSRRVADLLRSIHARRGSDSVSAGSRRTLQQSLTVHAAPCLRYVLSYSSRVRFRDSFLG